MKILLINYRYFISGGPERYLFNFKELFESKGHEIIPFSVKCERNEKTQYEPYFAKPLGGEDKVYFSEYKKTPKLAFDLLSRQFYSYHVRKRLENLIKDTRPDVAYILQHYNKLSPSVIDACHKYSIPIVMRLSDYFLLCPQAHFLCHNEICEDCLHYSYFNCMKKKCVKNSYIGSGIKAMSIYFHRRLLRIYDKVNTFVCTNEFMRTKMIQGGFPPEKLKVIKTFINTEQTDHLEVKQIKPYILYVGRLNFEKGVDLLIKAYVKSGISQNGIELKVFGGILSDISYVSFNDKELSIINTSVQFYGFRKSNEIEPAIENSLFTVVPSRWYDNLPNSILESYKFRKPVIATRLGSIPDVVIDHKTGLLFEPDNTDDLAEKLKKLSGDKGLRNILEKGIEENIWQYMPDHHYNSLMKVFLSSRKICNYE